MIVMISPPRNRLQHIYLLWHYRRVRWGVSYCPDMTVRVAGLPPFRPRLVAERDACRPGRHHDVVARVDSFRLSQRLDDRDADDVRRLQGHHLPEASGCDGAYCRASESGRQQAVVARQHPAPLQVSEYQRAALLARARLDFARELVRHSA